MLLRGRNVSMLISVQVNEKCDIFALGILLWECMTGTRPFKNMHAFQIMMCLQTNQKRGEDWLPFPRATPKEFKRLVRRCWHAENQSRISADEVCMLPYSTLEGEMS
jgi:serine/threonine protein kinase